jgi:hypothetical protein
MPAIVKRSALARVAGGLAAWMLGSSVWAHHSQQPFFYMERNIELTGVVRAFDFVNPHPVIFLRVPSESGEPIEWEIEGPTAIYLARNGWTKDSIVPGETITVRGAPPKKSGAHAMAGREVRKADGTVLRLYADDARRVLELNQ